MNKGMGKDARKENDIALAKAVARQQGNVPEDSRTEPVGRPEAADAELLERLYRRYARGGARLARIRGTAHFHFKKYSWIWVTESTYFVKRLLDVVVSALLLVLFAPLFLITAMAIKIDRPGPIFFRQTRVGKWGRLFTMYKFRSKIIGHAVY